MIIHTIYVFIMGFLIGWGCSRKYRSGKWCGPTEDWEITRKPKE